jgi:hypothetical protein
MPQKKDKGWLRDSQSAGKAAPLATTSRSAAETTKPPMQCVPGILKSDRKLKLTVNRHVMPRSSTCAALPPPSRRTTQA